MRDVGRREPAKIGLLDALLAALALLVAIAAAALHVFWVPVVGEMLQDFGGELPFATKLILLRAYGLTVAALTLLAAATGLALRLTSARTIARILLVLGVLTATSGLGLLVYGVYSPIFAVAGYLGP